MSLHKLTAGDGYTYLTRQVAAQDATHRGHDGLGDYYSQRGESPGVWMGRGADGLPESPGGFPGDRQVTEAQMVALFGEGRHPDAEAIEREMVAAGHGVEAVLAATRLGSLYKVASGATPYRVELARRFEAANAAAGLPRDWPLPEAERAVIRTQLGRELFEEQYGRPPTDARELAGLLARESRQPTTAVAGYDLTFTPVKSVSALWAVAPRQVAEAVEQCHTQAVEDVLGWLEEHAAYTRLGRNGVRQVDVRGLIAAAFVHRDSRAGDPNLHTHVAVSNKVQAAGPEAGGRWLALDGRPLHKLTVAASERYNTRLEALLTDRLGVTFAERAGVGVGPAGKRPVRELVGVDERLSRAWSARRALIDVRRAELATRFQAEHGRPPGPVEALKLAQRATLETRQAKHAPRTLAEQRGAWREQAHRVLGGPTALAAMLTGALQTVRGTGTRDRRASSGTAAVGTPLWVADVAETVLEIVQTSRATWQAAHVRAEAERQVRAASLPLARVDAAVELVVAAALSPACSLPLGVAEPVSEPAALRRRDGSSVYTSAGAQLYTSPAVVAAERELLALASQGGGRQATREAVELALLEAAAGGVPLNPGQAAMVRELATSGARVQLALAPAGTGKTTAMRVLARAWTGDGGTIIGLAPSAAAAAVLGEEIAAPTDTLAKLIWSLDTLEHPDSAIRSRRGPVPQWVRDVGPGTLVVLDEAGMAGTVDLARAASWILRRGASLRLVGDDAQLAAVGAGGVLRDLAETAGALTLSQVVRFTDPAEGAASLALRAGDPAAIGFYLDAGRVHVGDPATGVDAAYTAWTADRAAGRDALMLAPTRQVAAELNARARADRLAAGSLQSTTSGSQDREVRLADGSAASAGDTVVTRRNNRRLTLSRSDWVKNGDRWTVRQVLPDGALRVAHLGTGRTLTLPAQYTAEHVALGYASTVHAAQGSTADVCHTVATGAENRQLLYVAMTRGRTGNHLYLATAADGDEHSVLTPDALRPPTAVDLLTRILARDGAQTSATTAQQALADPAARLGAAADRYHDSLHTAALLHLGQEGLGDVDAAAEQAVPGLTAAPAWPTLRASLALLATDGTDPTTALQDALAQGRMNDAADPAAVLDWRLDPTGERADGPPQLRAAPPTGKLAGPLPWLPGVPAGLTADPDWGGYLRARHAHTLELARQVADRARGLTPTSAPAWAAPLLGAAGTPELLARLAVWRAANSVDDTDLRPTGPPRLPTADARAQRALDAEVRRALGDPAAAANRWRTLAAALEPRLLADPFWPQLADRLAAADRAGLDVPALTGSVMQQGPLPDEMPAAALWWRLSRHLTPAALQASDSDTGRSGPGTASTLRPSWSPALAELLGDDLTRRVLADPSWPALVAAVTDATAAGWTARQVLTAAHQLLAGTGAGTADRGDLGVRPGELTTALVWRVAMLADPEPPHPTDLELLPPDPEQDHLQPPEDLYDGLDDEPDDDAWPHPAAVDGAADDDVDEDWLSLLEHSDQPPADLDDDPDEPDHDRRTDHGQPRQQKPDRFPEPPPAAEQPGPQVLPERLLQLNAQALEYFAAAYPGSWAAAHLQQRLGTDLTGDLWFTPGYAPAGWTHLVDHLRAGGATDRELLEAGLASTARTGRLIDRFRDRLVLPIQTPDGIVGFIARRNPDTPHDERGAGPKYLNTADNAVFNKGAQLYGLVEGTQALAAGATPVLVEGPVDAIAVTLAAGGEAVGVAPLGTAFTDTQADSLRPYLRTGGPGVVVATDNDTAGRKAAERAYWQLTARGGDPRHAQLPDGQDPAELLSSAGPEALRDAITSALPLARTLVEARVAGWSDRLDTAEGTVLAVRAAAEVIGASPPARWPEHIAHLDTLVDAAPGLTHLEVLDAGHAWTTDPHALASQQLGRRTPTAGTSTPDGAGGQQQPLRDGAPPAPATPSPARAEPTPAAASTELVEQWAADVWRDVGRAADPRLIEGPDWPGLAAGLDRASRAGYDVQQHLPRLAAAGPLPDLRPARALQYRLVQECDAAIPPVPTAVRDQVDRQQSAAAATRLAEHARRRDDQQVSAAPTQPDQTAADVTRPASPRPSPPPPPRQPRGRSR